MLVRNAVDRLRAEIRVRSKGDVAGGDVRQAVFDGPQHVFCRGLEMHTAAVNTAASGRA